VIHVFIPTLIFAAITDRIHRDHFISAPLATELEQQFHGLSKFHEQCKTEGRLKTARCIGEITVFRKCSADCGLSLLETVLG
jgi:hypothetical protein